jgi:hypothetical protein
MLARKDALGPLGPQGPQAARGTIIRISVNSRRLEPRSRARDLPDGDQASAADPLDDPAAVARAGAMANGRMRERAWRLGFACAHGLSSGDVVDVYDGDEFVASIYSTLAVC